MLRATTIIAFFASQLIASFLWAANPATELPVIRSWETPHRIFALTMSDDGQLVAATGTHGIVSLWNAETGQLVKYCKGSYDDSTCAAISHDKKMLAVGGIEGDVQVFDIEAGKLLYSFNKNGSRLMRVAFAPDNKTIASACWDTTTRWWNAADGKPLGKSDSTPIGICAFTFNSKTGELLVPALFPGFSSRPGVPTNSPIQTVDINKGHVIGEIPQHETAWIVATSPDHGLLAVGTSVGNIHVWDSAERKKTGSWTVNTPEDETIGRGIVGLALLNDGKHFFAMTMNGFGGIYSAADGSQVKSIAQPTVDFASVAVAPSVHRAVTSQWNQKIELFDLSAR